MKKVFEHYQECVHKTQLRDVIEQIKIQVQDEFKHGLGTHIPEDRSTGALKIFFEKNVQTYAYAQFIAHFRIVFSLSLNYLPIIQLPSCS